MPKSICGEKIRLSAVINIVVVSAWVALIQPAIATEPHQPVATPPASPVASKNNAGMKIFVDPKTGKISKPTPQPELPEAVQRSLEMTKEPSPELLEMPSPRPGGGVMIDLKGQFRSPLKATRDADGKLSIKHQSETSGSGDKK